MKLNEYQDLATVTAVYGAGIKIIYPLMGMLGECGEVANKYQKVMRDKEGVLSGDDKKSIIKELGDILWFFSALATDLGVSLEDIAKLNIEKLNDRKKRNVISGSGDDR